MKSGLAVTLLLAAALTSAAQTTTITNACAAMTLGNNGAFNGFVPSPNDAWHQDISAAALDPNSSKIITTVGDLGGHNLHPDFSSIAGGNAGIPYTVVSGTPAIILPINLYVEDSDQTLYPLPASLPIEGSPAECSVVDDQHAIIIDRDNCVAYELYQASHCTSGYSASSTALWDFTTTEHRPYGLTSTDAAGLSVFSGLIRYDEIVAGVINHAIRFTAQHTKTNANHGYFIAPATHAAGNSATTDNIMGMRIRLRADFDISGYSSTNQIILKAMQKYGMILADNGSDMYFQGTPDARWNDDDLSKLKTIPSSVFEVVQMGPVYDASTAPTGAAPTIVSFTASPSTASPGATVTLTPVVTNGSYSFIDKAGFVRDAITVTPSATTTYTLTSRNAFGTSTATTTVTVVNGTTPTLAFTPIAAQTYGVAPFTISATSNSPGAITTSVTSGPATISGSTLTLTGVGTVALQANQAATGTYTAAIATTSFTVAKATGAISFNTITPPTIGASVTVSTNSNSNGAISYAVVSGPATVSGNIVTVTAAGTVTLQADLAATSTYTAGTATTSFTITGAATPTLAFTPIAAQTYGAAPFAISATSNSTGAITYSVLSGPASISNNIVTITGAGSVVLQASEAATTTYTAATTTTTFTVAKATPTLTFNTIPQPVTIGSPVTLSATSNSTGTITYSIISGPATISGNTVTATSSGTVSLQASLAPTSNYTAATTTTNFTVAAPSTPTLTFTPIAAQTYGVASFAISATSNSTGAITYAVLSGPATISANIVTITGAGTVVLQASESATTTYTATTTTTSFTVSKATPTLAFSTISQPVTVGTPLTVSATSNSSGAITYSVVSGPATISGNTVTATSAGTITLQANLAATSNYAAATAQTSFTAVAAVVTPAATTTSLTAVSTLTLGTSIITIHVAPSVSSTSVPTGTISIAIDGQITTSLPLINGAATYTYSSPGLGSHTVTAAYSGSTAYAASTGSISISGIINPSPQPPRRFTLTAANTTVASGTSGASSFTVTPDDGYTGTIAFSVTASSNITNACYLATNATVLNAEAVNTPLTIYTNATTCSSLSGATALRSTKANTVGLSLATLFAAVFFARRSRKLRPLCALCILSCLTLSGCGSGILAAPSATTNASTGTYNIVVTAADTADPSITASTTFTLTIN